MVEAMTIFKATAEGDTMYISADSKDSAKRKLTLVCGPIPDSMIDWTEVDSLPEGEELTADPE